MRTNQKRIHLVMLQVIRLINNRKLTLLVLLILVILILSLGLIHGSLGRFSRSVLLSDSAVVSKFDVIITAPEELTFGQSGNVFEYDFISASEVKSFDFYIFNNGETGIICTPGVTNGVNYKVLISGTQTWDFAIGAKEGVSIQLLIEPQGLNAGRTDAVLYIDIHQSEGGA